MISTRYLVPLALALGSLPLVTHAEEGPTFDCAKAESSAEKLICAEPELAALDRGLAARFAKALAVAQGLDAGAKEAEDRLRATQRGWISGRDECWKEPELRACVQTAYLRREAELVAGFLLEQASNIAELSCGDGARRLTIYEFPTPLPGIRVEEGDGVHVGAQSAAETPGSYYVSSWGGVTLEGAEISVSDVYGTVIPCRPVN